MVASSDSGCGDSGSSNGSSSGRVIGMESGKWKCKSSSSIVFGDFA